MEEMKYSALLQELIDHAKGVGKVPNFSLTAEKLIISLMDKIQAPVGMKASDEWMAAKELLCKEIPDFAHARNVLMERINMNLIRRQVFSSVSALSGSNV